MVDFKELYSINVNENVEKKNGLSYLSWAWAWAEFMKQYPQAEYEIVKFNGLPYAYDPNTGYMVYTKVTVDGQTREMWLPVMDGANKAMKSEPYRYTVKNQNFKWAKLDPKTGKYVDKYGNVQEEYIEKICEAATMFDINKTIMRCLVKNLAMFGLGLYIYAGEDLPEETKIEKPTNKVTKEQAEYIAKNSTEEQLIAILDKYKIESLYDLDEATATKIVLRINQLKMEENNVRIG